MSTYSAGHKRYVQTHRAEINNKRNIKREAARNLVLQTFGKKCGRCGFKDIRALQIDHVNGDGKNERKMFLSSSYDFYKAVLESIKKGQKRYQLLCANCNWIKRAENSEHNPKKYKV